MINRLIIVGLIVSLIMNCTTRVYDEIGEIRREVDRIQSQLSDLQQTERILLGVSAEGASVIAYRADRSIRKIAVEALGETGKYMTDFYFSNGKILFCYSKIIDYGRDIMDSLEGKELEENIVEENRFFFADDKLVHWLKFEDAIPPSNQRYEHKGQAILAEARSYVLFMNTPLPEDREDHCDWICDREQDGDCVEFKCK